MNKKMNKLLNSSALFVYPSFLKGISRIVDMFGYMDIYNYKSTEIQADTEALRRDWSIIGMDIQDAIGVYEQQSKKSLSPKGSKSITAKYQPAA